MILMRTFTLEEANALIPQVDDLLLELAALRRDLATEAPSYRTILDRASGNGGNHTAGEYMLRLQHYNALAQTISEMGIEIRDLDRALVDFPSYREGRIVYLCWQRGEPKIEYWHETDAGFGGRQPL